MSVHTIDLSTHSTAEYLRVLQQHGIRLNQKVPKKRSLTCSAPISIESPVLGHVQVGAFSFVRGQGRFNARVGKYCSIAPGVAIGDGEHPTEYVSTHPFQYQEDLFTSFWTGLTAFERVRAVRSAPAPVFGNDVWVGTHSVILRGVTLGDGAVVGAGSVVTKDVPAYAIVTGTPAKILKYRFDESVIPRMLATRWWDYTLDSLNGLPWNKPQEFLDEFSQRLAAGRLQEQGPARLLQVEHDSLAWEVPDSL